MSLIWIPLALFAGFSAAVMIISNQYFKLSGLHLVIISRAFTLAMLSPIGFFIEWPSSPIYYIAIAITGILASYGDIRIFNAVAKIGGGVVSRLMPLLVPVTFVFWFVLQPSDIALYLATPIRTFGIIMALSACVFFAMQLQAKCEVSKKALKLMIPVVIAYGINGALAKLAMNHATLYEGVYGYMVIQSLSSLFFAGAYYIYKRETIKKIKINPRLLYLSFFASLIWMSSIALKISSLTFIDNPAYPNALVLLSPLWIILFYKLTKHKENANISSGIGILISTIILVILTAL